MSAIDGSQLPEVIAVDGARPTGDLEPGAPVRSRVRAGSVSRATRSGSGRLRERLTVVLITLALAGWRLVLAAQAGGPTIFTDETLYFNNAKRIATLSLYYNGHYPPVYSMVLAPAFWIGADDPWRATLVVSAVVGASIVPAAYWLARSAGARLPVAAALFVATLVGTSAYSQQLMSEAVGVPLVLFGIGLALRGRRTPPLVIGIVTVLLCLTKYLYVPLAIVLLLAWWWMRRRGSAMDDDGATGSPARATAARSLKDVALVALPYVVAVPLWLLYATASGASLARATGADIVDRTARSGDLASLAGPIVLWAGLYVGYLVVACVPPLLVLSWLALSRGTSARLVGALRSRVVSRRVAFLLVATVLTAGYLVLAVRHSLGARYNQPDPHHYMGRYLTHLVPVLAVAAVVGLDMVLERRAALRTWRPWVGGLVTAAAVYGGFAALFGSVFARYDELWGATFRTLSPDVYALGTPRVRTMLLVLVVVSTVLVAMRRRLSTVLVWIVVAALGTAASFPTFLESRGGHAHKLADIMHGQSPQTGRVVLCLAPGVKVPSVGALSFWEMPKSDIVGLAADDAQGDAHARLESCRATASTVPGDAVLYVTDEPTGGVPVLVDERWGSRLYVFTE